MRGPDEHFVERLVNRLLSGALPEGPAGESIRADLAEELQERRKKRPGNGHRFWYAWEAVKLTAHFWVFRMRGRSAPGHRTGGAPHRVLPGRGPWGGGLDSLLRDLRFAARTLARRPGFAAAAILTLGLGIGSATAMFSVVNGVLLESVPFSDPGELVDVWLTAEHAKGAPGLVGRTWNRLPLSLSEYRAWQAGNTTFSGIAVHNATEATLTGEGPAERIKIGFGSASLLDVVGVRPMVGRWFLPEEEGRDARAGDASRVVVLSYELWRDRFGFDPGAPGRTLTLGGEGYTIIGVMPAGFRLRYLGMHWMGEDLRGARDVWAPIGSPGLGNGNNLEALARIAPGVSREAAQAEASRILLAEEGEGEVRISARAADETTGLSSPLWLLLGATGLLLLIGCANVATLSLGEMHTRASEITTRAALGAERGRIARQLLTESLVLGLLGTGLGAILALGGTELLVALAPPLPRAETVHVNLRVLAFAGALGTLSGVISGMVPALAWSKGSSPGTASNTRTATRRSNGVEGWLVPIEIALTVVLLVSAGLLGRSLQRLLEVDPGFDSRGLATVSVYLPQDRYSPETELVAALDDLVARMADLAGVSGATAITRLPFPGLTNTNTLTVLPEGGGEPLRFGAQQLYIMPGYHKVMGIPLVNGRLLDDLDPEGPPEMLVTENIARRYWPQGSPLGSQVQGWNSSTIVGVVGDEKRNSLGVEADPAFYMSLRQRPAREVSLVARTSGDPAVLAGRMRDAVRAWDPNVPVRQVTTLPLLIADSASQERYRTLLLGVFGALATLLAAVGIFGTTGRAVAQRSREMGIRLSLGAEEGRLVAAVVTRRLLSTLAGTAAGLLLAGWAGRFLAGLLFGVEAFDPGTYGVVALSLTLISVVASWLPARRIASLDPATVLRAD